MAWSKLCRNPSGLRQQLGSLTAEKPLAPLAPPPARAAPPSHAVPAQTAAAAAAAAAVVPASPAQAQKRVVAGSPARAAPPSNPVPAQTATPHWAPAAASASAAARPSVTTPMVRIGTASKPRYQLAPAPGRRPPPGVQSISLARARSTPRCSPNTPACLWSPHHASAFLYAARLLGRRFQGSHIPGTARAGTMQPLRMRPVQADTPHDQPGAKVSPPHQCAQQSSTTPGTQPLHTVQDQKRQQLVKALNNLKATMDRPFMAVDSTATLHTPSVTLSGSLTERMEWCVDHLRRGWSAA